VASSNALAKKKVFTPKPLTREKATFDYAASIWESELWHGHALKAALLFIPEDCPLIEHVAKSYSKHYLLEHNLLTSCSNRLSEYQAATASNLRLTSKSPKKVVASLNNSIMRKRKMFTRPASGLSEHKEYHALTTRNSVTPKVKRQPVVKTISLEKKQVVVRPMKRNLTLKDLAPKTFSYVEESIGGAVPGPKKEPINTPKR